jgi:hypothetical protein
MQLMTKKNAEEMGWEKARKVAISAIRLKYTLLADEEINEVIPALQEQYQAAIDAERPWELDTASLMRRVDDGVLEELQ